MSRQVEYIVNKSTRKQIKYDQAGQEVSIGRFPIGTQLSVNVTINEAFDNSNTVKVGTPLNQGGFFASKAVVAKGGETSGARFITTEKEKEVVATVSGTATAGAVTITVDYTLPTNEEVSY